MSKAFCRIDCESAFLQAFPFAHNRPIANSVTPGTIHIMYDPVQKAEETAKIVCRGERRKYRRFRPARFYGGIATADCVGCCLRCIFCWSWHELARCEAIGEFYTPEQVAAWLTAIARKTTSIGNEEGR